MDDFKNLHECLQNSAIDLLLIPKQSEDKIHATQTFQIPKDLKMFVDDICKQNATTTSAFLRSCCLALFSEYYNCEYGSEKYHKQIKKITKTLA